MKNYIIITLLLLITSCKESTAKPIDVYRNKGIVVLRDIQGRFPNDVIVRCKTKDSVFNIIIPYYDGKDLKPGDTIK